MRHDCWTSSELGRKSAAFVLSYFLCGPTAIIIMMAWLAVPSCEELVILPRAPRAAPPLDPGRVWSASSRRRASLRNSTGAATGRVYCVLHHSEEKKFTTAGRKIWRFRSCFLFLFRFFLCLALYLFVLGCGCCFSFSFFGFTSTSLGNLGTRGYTIYPQCICIGEAKCSVLGKDGWLFFKVIRGFSSFFPLFLFSIWAREYGAVGYPA